MAYTRFFYIFRAINIFTFLFRYDILNIPLGKGEEKVKNIFSFVLLVCLCASLCACIPMEVLSPQESIPALPDDGRIVVVLDAGHGFGDPGCASEYLQGTEAEVTLDMVNLLAKELTSLGAEVVLTHDGGRFPTAEEIITLCVDNGVDYRADLMVEDTVFSAYERGIYVLALSKELPIDFFVSLHVNNFPSDPSVDRYELFYYENNPYRLLIDDFCSSLAEKLDNTAKIGALDKDNAYIVTKYGSYPSVLIETGFASNSSAAEKLNSDTWRAEFCKTLAQEIINAVKQ